MFKGLMLSASVAVLLAGCAGGGNYNEPGPRGYDRADRYDGCSDNAAVGTVAGAVVGGVIGNQFGHGSGKPAATVGGVILGGIAGNAIARDACKNERADAYYYNQTYYDAFDRPQYGRQYEWRNPNSGNYGYVTPMRRAEGRNYGYRDECREFRHTVFVHGEQYEDVSVACRADDGSWHIVSR